MARMSLSPSFPKIRLPECPSTVETGKLGISLYEMRVASVISLASLPNPVPKTIAVVGLVVILLFSQDAVS